MSWVKLDDRFFDNPKIAALSAGAQIAYLKATTYCARELTDGFVAQRKAREYASLRVIRELVPGLWETCAGGFLVHDYLKYNPTRAQAMAERDAAKRRMFGLRSGGSSGEHLANNERSSGVGTDAPVKPIPSIPVDPVNPDPPPDPIADAAAAFAKFGKVTSGTVQAIEADVKDFGIEWVQKAIHDAAKAGFDDKPAWSYVNAILERFKKQGGPDNERLQAPQRANGRSKRRPESSDDVVAGWEGQAARDG